MLTIMNLTVKGCSFTFNVPKVRRRQDLRQHASSVPMHFSPNYPDADVTNRVATGENVIGLSA